MEITSSFWFRNFKIITLVKSIEVWHYGQPGSNNSLKTWFNEEDKGEMKFIFTDEIGSGFFKILDTSENPGEIDSRIMRIEKE